MTERATESASTAESTRLLYPLPVRCHLLPRNRSIRSSEYIETRTVDARSHSGPATTVATRWPPTAGSAQTATRRRDRDFEALAAAARAGAATVPERPKDPYRSFLEATLEVAIAHDLPGRTELAQQRRRFELPGFEPYPNGVDIDWRDHGVHAGIEVKVWDVLHSLFDVVKLATAIFHGRLDEGFCAVAALSKHWAAGSSFSAMTAGPTAAWQPWNVEQLIAAPAERKSILVASGPRPFKVPARIETMAAEPIAMPRAPLHTLRLLAIRPAVGTDLTRLPSRAG